ncbi:MAG: hypothetical protein QX189_03210 [Methylococcales bacterium]
MLRYEAHRSSDDAIDAPPIVGTSYALINKTRLNKFNTHLEPDKLVGRNSDSVLRRMKSHLYDNQ